MRILQGSQWTRWKYREQAPGTLGEEVDLANVTRSLPKEEPQRLDLY